MLRYNYFFVLQSPIQGVNKYFNMFLLLYLTACFFATSTAVEIERSYYHIEKTEEYFEEFIITHGKTYQNIEEKQMRFEIFKEKLIHINHLNTVSETVHGINQFTDLKKEEFSEQYNSCLYPIGKGFGQSSCRVVTDADINTQAPPTLDYRQKNSVTLIKNQANCSCCWAFAITGSLEGMNAIKHGQLQSLSAQQLMDCLSSSGHCVRGAILDTVFSELITTPGVESESDYPYVNHDLQCKLQLPKARVRVTGCNSFQLSEEKYKEALVMFGPIVIGIDVEPLQTHWTGIVDATLCPPGRPGHAVLLVGYGTEAGKDYWIIKNSWGEAWGEQGYVRFARGQNVCGMLVTPPMSGNIA